MEGPRWGMAKWAALVALAALAARLVVIWLYVAAYDRHQEGTTFPHMMFQGDANTYFRGGALVKERLRTGERSLWTAGEGWRFTHPRLLGLWGLVADKRRYERPGVPATGQVTGFLVFQALAFSVCLAIFLVSAAGAVPRPVLLLAGLFLAVEPILAQYCALIMTETLFLSFILLALAVWFRARAAEPREAPRRFVVLWLLFGVSLGVVFLQREIVIFLPLFFLPPLLVPWDRRRLARAAGAAALAGTGYLGMLGLYGLHNLHRTGVYYIVTDEAFNGPIDLAAEVLAGRKGTRPVDEVERIKALALEAAIERGVVRRGQTLTPEEFLAVSYHVPQFTTRVFRDYPVDTVRLVAWGTLKSLHFNPFWPYWFVARHDELAAGKQGLAGWKLLYTLLILIPVAVGWIVAVRSGTIGGDVICMLTCLALYLPVVAGWRRNPQYVMANLLPYSVFWSAGAIWLAARLRRSAAP